MTANKQYIRLWLPDLLVTFALALVVTLTFSLGNADIQAAACFYDGLSADNPWPQEHWPLWRFLYYTAPLLTALLAVGGLALMVAGTLWNKWRRGRLYGLFLFLSVVLGPGLVVNAVFKDHWGRPRPRQVEQLGGDMKHLPPLVVKGQSGAGKSFPCGHASVGFAYCALYFIYRRRRPLLAFALLGGSILLGGLIGVGRMAGGGHFLSDVFWAFLLTFWVCQLLYFVGLQVPRREDSPGNQALLPLNPRAKALALGGYTILGMAMLLGVALATPEREDVSIHIHPTPDGSTQHYKLRLERTRVQVRWDELAPLALHLQGTVHGFGLPTNKVREHYSGLTDGAHYYELTIRGWFTELDSQVQITLNPQHLELLELELPGGKLELPAGSPEAWVARVSLMPDSTPPE